LARIEGELSCPIGLDLADFDAINNDFIGNKGSLELAFSSYSKVC